MYDDKFIKQVVDNRLDIKQIKNPIDYFNDLSNNPVEAETLLQLLNNNHTEFFRNTLTFAHLEQWMLPNIMETKIGNNELRIWSAGCSTGQEAYSIAMLIENINSKKKEKTRYRIIATDISETALLEANKGIYNESDILKIRVKDLNDFFLKSGDKFKINEGLKKNISFTTYDLLDNLSAYPHESIFGNFDLVICCNLLFYYKQNHQDQILAKLINSMDENGFLITGETEKQSVSRLNDLYLVVPPSPIFKKRRGAK
jgi:chemotaxis methyl-accepting protein methylase